MYLNILIHNCGIILKTWCTQTLYSFLVSEKMFTLTYVLNRSPNSHVQIFFLPHYSKNYPNLLRPLFLWIISMTLLKNCHRGVIFNWFDIDIIFYVLIFILTFLFVFKTYIDWALVLKSHEYDLVLDTHHFYYGVIFSRCFFLI